MIFFVGTPLFLFSKSFKSISFFELVKRGCLGTIISKEFLIGNEANENEKKSALSKKNLTGECSFLEGGLVNGVPYQNFDKGHHFEATFLSFLFCVCFVFRSCLFGRAGFWVRRMKGGRIFVLMCICSFAFFSLFLLLQRSSKADSSQEHKRSFRVASYNLWNVNYHWKLRLSRLRDIIEEKDFDVIALQEVPFFVWVVVWCFFVWVGWCKGN